jgi:hypothetical protein
MGTQILQTQKLQMILCNNGLQEQKLFATKTKQQQEGTRLFEIP